ncbi:ABC transporter permease [Luteipulveratus mongoliensis]|uniref:Sugar ABC transporter n=1 Tax=Luteipulveratus mongoliensis TaxID=571913 RepID=A0A0K1JDQ1_9MICO|nr:ABC transporter permease [Luteipulveratus mongoliensis]AKU14710.1 sugar ABC transporter [Luteipulveratus mongoliensis]
MTAQLETREPSTAKVARRILPSPVTGQEWVLGAVLVALWVILSFTTPAFATSGSWQPLLASVAPVAVMGVGMTAVIITGGIDVSVGGAMMVTGVTTAKMLVDQDVSLPVAVLLAMALGAVLGLVNGLLIAYGHVHAIIITFGTANVLQFVGRQIFNSQTVNGIPDTLDFFSRGENGRTLGIPHSFVLTLVIAVLAWIYLRHMRGGRHLYAIGGDPLAARLAGIRVQRYVVLTYAVTGLLVGLAAVFTIASGTSTLDQSIGSGQELAVIAAVVIGGTSITGGRGSVLGTVLGALLVQTVSSGVTQLGWPSQLSDFFVGLAIAIAVGADLLRQRTRQQRTGQQP